MIKISALLFFFLFFNQPFGFAQSPNPGTHSKTTVIPAAVTSHFNEMFKGITELKWNETAGNYVASFTHESKPCKAYFKPDGTFIQEIITLTPFQIPATVTHTLKTDYAGKTPSKAQMVKLEDGTVYFGITLNSKLLKFDPSGKVLSDSTGVTH